MAESTAQQQSLAFYLYGPTPTELPPIPVAGKAMDLPQTLVIPPDDYRVHGRKGRPR